MRTLTISKQPTGGRYDGILGVHAGIEAIKTLSDHKIETEYPTGVINWTNEEGARFPISMVASGVWAGAYDLETAHGLVEVVCSVYSFLHCIRLRGGIYGGAYLLRKC